MFRLYLRFYLALLASLILFGFAAAILVHFNGSSIEQNAMTLGRLVQNALPANDSPSLQQQAALRRLAAGLNADVTLFDGNGVPIVSTGHPLPAPGMRHREMLSYIHLADGRWVGVDAPIGYAHRRFVFHAVLALLAVGIGVAAFPVVRQITRRLERLQRGVESLGAGDLTARVAVEGNDEVAQLAESFNRSAGQIEQLVQVHKTLLANASHELRTPLARIRLAVELIQASPDARLKLGLEQDIAELDWLVDEILLASRLDAIPAEAATEVLDLLALAAEECARYDDAHLEGALVGVRGDARLLRRLLRNLLENARRHGAPSTQVRIARTGADATITVWDSGAGIPGAEFDRVFQPFYRPKDARDAAGTGLGLALVRQIARRHGGDARCILMSEGRSAFIVNLPATAS